MSKDPNEQKYKNIPVKPDVYEDVKLIAMANGFGERGLGAQIADWVSKELPECEHEKTPVEIEYFPSSDLLPGSLRKRTGYFCATCMRVYERVSDDASVTRVADVADAGSTPARLKVKR